MRCLRTPTVITVLAVLSAGRLVSAADVARSETCETIRDIVYAQPGGYTLRADIYRPPGRGPFPAVLCVHGGAWALGSKYQMARIAQRLAAHGYAAVSIDYRYAPQFLFPAQLDDCRAAWNWMHRQRPKLQARFAADGSVGLFGRGPPGDTHGI